MRAYSIGSMVAAVSFAVLGLAGGCSSSGGGGGGTPCSDAGTCPGDLICNSAGMCVPPAGTGGTGATGTGGSSGEAGSAGGTGGGFGGTGGGGPQGCSAACAKGATDCPMFSQSACETECAAEYGNAPTNCLGFYDGLLSCAATTSWECDGSDAVPSGCDAQIQALTDCLFNNTGGGGTGGTGGFGGTGGGGSGGTGGGTLPNITPICAGLPTTPPSGGSCYAGVGSCNPGTNSECSGTPGSACDLGETGYQCYGPPNDVACGGACDGSSGPFCLPGFTCLGGGGSSCARYCCTDADCGGATGSCTDLTALAGYTLKVCGTAAP
jgi:hypothetical protein